MQSRDGGRSDVVRRARRGDAARHRPLHPGVRHPPVDPVERAALAVGASSAGSSARHGSASPRSSTRSASPGLAAWRPRRSRRRWPGVRRSTRRSSQRDGARDRRVDARSSASTRGSRRCSTSCATRGGAGSRSASARTRTSSARSAPRTCAACRSAGMHATLKHFVGYSGIAGPAATSRRCTRAGASSPTSSSRRSRWPSCDGGARSVMNAYNDIDGVPVAAERRAAHRRAARALGLRRRRRRRLLRASRSCTSLHGVAADRGDAAAWRSRPASTSSCRPATPTCSRSPPRVRAGARRRGARRSRRAARAAPRRRSSACSTRRFEDEPPPTVDLDSPGASRGGAAPRGGVGRAAVERRHAAAEPVADAPARVAVIGPERRPSRRRSSGCYSFVNHVLAHHPERAARPRGPDASSRRCGAEFDRQAWPSELVVARGCDVEGDDTRGFADGRGRRRGGRRRDRRRRRPGRAVRPRHGRRGQRPRRPGAARACSAGSSRRCSATGTPGRAWCC